MTTKSTARNALATLALFAFAAFGSACDFNNIPQPGLTDQMDLAAPAPAVPCNPKPSALR